MGNLKILIADDEPVIVDLIKTILTKIHPEVPKFFEVTFDGQMALECATKIKFDLITLDLRMPPLVGAKVLTRLRHVQSKNALTPVIVISGFIEDVLYRFENVYYIEKPINEKNLLNLSNRLTDKPSI